LIVEHVTREYVGEGLLQRPVAQAGESLLGYLIRLAKANFLPGIRGLASIHRMRAVHLLKVDRRELIQRLWGCAGLKRDDSHILLSCEEPTLFGSFAPCRVCVPCLREAATPTFRQAWDSPMSLHCTKHLVMLRDSCASCGARLDYLKLMSVRSCNCGADLSDQATSPVTDDLEAMRRVFSVSGVCDIDENQRERMAATVVIKMAHHISDHDRFVDTVKVRQPFVTHGDFEWAKPWFDRWPEGFRECCEKVGWTRGSVLRFGRQAYLHTRQFAFLDDAFLAILLRPSEHMDEGPPSMAGLLKFPRIFCPTPIPQSLPRRWAAQTEETSAGPERSTKAPSGDDGLPVTYRGVVAPYPTGSIPILLIAWFATAAAEGRSRVRPADQLSYGQFTRIPEIERSAYSKQFAPVKIAKPQKDLLRSRFRQIGRRLQLAGDGSDDVGTLGICMIRPKAEEPGEQTSIVLSEWFVEQSSKRNVDLNAHCLWVLKRDRLALDLYIWLRCRAVDGSGGGTIAWECLRDELGSNVRLLDRFRDNVGRALANVGSACPSVIAAPSNAGLTYSFASTFGLDAR